MRDSDQIRAEISEVQARLETVGQDIQRKQQDLTKLKDSHVQWVESNIGKERLPKSVGKQRQSLLTLGLEIENLEVVRDKIEGKLADLQRELYRSELYGSLYSTILPCRTYHFETFSLGRS
jgi:chromosome segregation ATPase